MMGDFLNSNMSKPTHQAVTSAGCHRLPQIATMGKHVRTAQSKTSAKLQSADSKPREAALLHVEGTSKVVKILTDGNEFSELLESFEQMEEDSLREDAKKGEIPHIEEDIVPHPKENKNDVESTPVSSVEKNENDAESTLVSSVKKRQRRQSSKVKESIVSSGKKGKKVSVGGQSLQDESTGKKGDHMTTDEPSQLKDPSLRTSKQLQPVNENPSNMKVNTSVKQEKGVCKRQSGKKKTEPVDEESTLAISAGDEETPSDEGKEEVAISPSEEESSDKDIAHHPRCVLIMPAEIPTAEQLEKLMATSSDVHDQLYPPTYEEGDTLWAKVSGHPYWPCMVSSCPFTKMTTRIKGDVRTVRCYHVQFFGNEVERGWINESSSLPFEGKLKFLEKAQAAESPKPAKKGKGGQNPFKINLSRRLAWNIAVDEAEAAMSLPLDERKKQYLFEYVFVDDVKKEKRVKLEQPENVKSEQPETKNEDGSPKAKRGYKRKRQESESLDQASTSLKRSRLDGDESIESLNPIDVPETSFDTYVANHLPSVMKEHPLWDTSFVLEYLKQQWSLIQQWSLGPSIKKKGSPQKSSSQKGTPKTPDNGGSKRRGPKPKAQKDSSSSALEISSFVTSVIESVAAGITETPSPQTSSKKRGRPKKNPELPASGVTSQPNTPTSSSVGGEDIPENTSKTKTAASVCARKASQDSNSSVEVKGKGLRENEPYELEIFKLHSTGKIERDNVCVICEKNGNVVECTGSCGQHFHASCLDLDSVSPEVFKCVECTSGIHSCFTCKKADGGTKKCAVPLCGKYYHEDCVRAHRLTRFESKGFTCPLHTCATCAVENIKNPKATKGRLYKCVRCPTAYHVGDLCIAAGSFNLAGSNILCSKHFQPNKSLTLHSRLNITWCFSCSKGGTLLCCESCPAAFHPECVKVDKTPDGAWYCMDCTDGRQPLYGNIVWIKVGNYRWWPGEICHPCHVPLNIQEKAHQVGEFPVRFFGSHDYYWIHKGRVFLFQEGDKGSRDGSSRGLFKIYMRGVQEATEAYKLWTAHKAKKEELEQERTDKKPAPYKAIKSNVPIGNVQIYKAELSEIPRCECKPDQEKACESDCLNRMMMYECHPAVCPAGDKCQNQRFQKRLYPSCEPMKCNGRGWGLRCNEDIKKGQFVCEYVGDLIDEEECKKRIEQSHEDNITNFYMLTMDKNRIIDAGPKGNFSRFMNHSCCPNIETQKWMVNGDIRVGLFALCDISKGSELTFNYNLECLGNEKKACACGAENCSGFLGVRPKTAAAAANEKRAKEPKKRKRKKKNESKKEYEDDCFRCGEGGELVLCDNSNCPKVYHLHCLKLTKPPSGKWLCPWHHCDDCGKLAMSKCSECPNSYCNAHTEGNIFKFHETLICSDHTDLLESLTESKALNYSTGDEQSGAETGMDCGDKEIPIETKDEKATGLLASILQSDLKPSDIPIKVPVDNLAKPAARQKRDRKKIKNKESGCGLGTGGEPMEVSYAAVNDSVASGPLSSVTDIVQTAVQGKERISAGGTCRTKARYKARLTNAQNGPAKLNKPGATQSLPGQDSDNEFSDLVIDLPL